MKNLSGKYPPFIRILHWLMALLMIFMLALGLYMTDIPNTDPLHLTLFNLHKSIGVTVLLLAFIRLACRFFLGVPPLPTAIPKTERAMGHLGHFGLYFFMFALPLSGLIMTNSFGFVVHWFGIALPRIVSVNPPRGHLAADWHEYMAYALILLIALHVAGALKHLWKERINLFKRMW